MRTRLKPALELLLLRGGPAAIARNLHRRRSLVLAYHNVVPDGAEAVGDPSLHLSRERFRRQLQILTRRHDVVPLGEVVGGRHACDRPRVAITFDDAYRGALTIGMEELRAFGLPSTVFVAPGRLGGQAFWWDVLRRDGGCLSDALRERALVECRGEQDRVFDWARGLGLSTVEVPEWCRTVTEAELRAVVARRDVTLASHSWSHANLAVLGRDEVEKELGRSLRWLEELFPDSRAWISYPYGRRSAAVESAARRTGYTAGFLISGGWVDDRSRGGRTFAVPRFNVPANISARGFELRLAGLLCR